MTGKLRRGLATPLAYPQPPHGPKGRAAVADTRNLRGIARLSRGNRIAKELRAAPDQRRPAIPITWKRRKSAARWTPVCDLRSQSVPWKRVNSRGHGPWLGSSQDDDHLSTLLRYTPNQKGHHRARHSTKPRSLEPGCYHATRCRCPLYQGRARPAKVAKRYAGAGEGVPQGEGSARPDLTACFTGPRSSPVTTSSSTESGRYPPRASSQSL